MIIFMSVDDLFANLGQTDLGEITVTSEDLILDAVRRARMQRSSPLKARIIECEVIDIEFQTVR